MHVLYIYGGTSNKKIAIRDDDIASSYNLHLGSIVNSSINNINDSVLLNNIAQKNIKDYSEYIYSQNKNFIAQGLILDKKLSLYFLSDFSCKRSELFSTYSDYCSAILIKTFILDNNIDRIVVDNTSFEFYTMIESISAGAQCQSIDLVVEKYKLFKLGAKHMLFFGKTLISVIIRGLFDNSKSSESVKKIDKLFLTRYPLHLNYKMKEDKYAELAKGKDFLVNIITDGFHQNVGIFNFMKHINSLSTRDDIYILDRYLKISDVVKSFISIFSISKKFRMLLKKEYMLNDIDMSAHINNELKFSMARIPRLLMWKKPLSRFIKTHRISSFYYYLHEYTYGRMFTYTFKIESPDTYLIGFQHGPASSRKLLYMAANNELLNRKDAINSFPVPNKILAEDRHSANIYKSSGYNNVQVMKKIYRLSYLKNINRNNTVSNLFLIAPGLHDGEFLMKSLVDLILNNKQCQFILKTHPRGGNRYVDNFLYLKNLKIETDDIEKILSKVSKVYATYSSVAIEARLLNIDVTIIDIPGRINESPLIDASFQKSLEAIKHNLKI